LNGLFGFLRTFKANAAEIFRKFESFAEGFVDVENIRFSMCFRRPITGRGSFGARFQPVIHYDLPQFHRATGAAPWALALV
jgi:hypothetical protein